MVKGLKKGGDRPAPVVHDDRFSAMHTDAIFKKTKKDSKKVKVDDRFKSVLTDDRFRVAPGAVDVYGRKSKKTAKAAARELSEFYQIEDESEQQDDQELHSAKKRPEKAAKGSKSSGGAIQGDDAESRLDYLNRLARGEISGSSSSSDEESESSEEESSDSEAEGRKKSGKKASAKVDHRKASKKAALESSSDSEEADGQTQGPLVIPGEGEVETGESTSRIALQNCDWENLKAQDIMVALQSFCPTGKVIRRVTVYPSDFGKESMAYEAIHGPPDIWTKAQKAKKDAEDALRRQEGKVKKSVNKGQKRGDDGSSDAEYDINSSGDEEDEEEDEEVDEDEEEDEDGEDVYDGIVPVADGEQDSDEGSDAEDEGDEEDDEDDEAAEAEDGNQSDDDGDDGKAGGKSKKADRRGDFRRRKGAIGVVLQDELVRRGISRKDDLDNYRRDPTAADGANKKKSMKQRDDDENGFDVVALRAYELSKLRYYFAVAECDSVETADALYQQLDGVEFGHSSMVFDLRFVPDDISFADREIRDTCTEVGLDYKPPDFIVNALQHTNVQCTWDEGEKDRDRKLTNISQWRQLNESELMQYIASSDSEEEEEEEVEQESDKKKRAAKLRKLLLGDIASSDDDDDDDDEGAGNDEFFMAEDGGSGDDDSDEDVKTKKKTEKNSKAGKEEMKDMVFTYVPDAGKELLDKKKQAQKLKEETPFEAMQRKMAEKKKARKQALKQRIAAKDGSDDGDDDEEDLSHYADYDLAGDDDSDGGDDGRTSKGKGGKNGKEGKGKNKNKNKGKGIQGGDDNEEDDPEAARKSRAQLELLYAGEDEDDDKEGYDMRAVIKEEKDRQKKNKKRKGKNSNKEESKDDFAIDLGDSRFSRLLEGDGSFGIDRTSTEFKETPAMRKILEEQRKRRIEKEKNDATSGHAEKLSGAAGGGGQESKDVNVDSLVNKLKRKFAEQPQLQQHAKAVKK